MKKEVQNVEYKQSWRDVYCKCGVSAVIPANCQLNMV